VDAVPTGRLRGAGHADLVEQPAKVMMKFETVVTGMKPDWVLVYGDVNSTVAAALVCAKLLLLVAHVEAGLRSGDRTMPEEINRIVTDQLSDLLLTHSPEADEHLRVRPALVLPDVVVERKPDRLEDRRQANP